MARSGSWVSPTIGEDRAAPEHSHPGATSAAGNGRPPWRIRLSPGPPAVVLRSQLQRRIQELDLFAGCDRRTLRRVAQWGDIIEVKAQETVLAEGTVNYWFFVVLSGSVRLNRSGRVIATVGPGSHFGEDAIVGLRPQTVTAVASAPSVLFVLGARYLLSLAATSVPFQRTLFPEVEPADYPRFAQQMLIEGRQEWRKLGPIAPDALRRAPPAPQARPPGRALSLREAVALLAPSSPAQPAGVQPHQHQRRRPRWLVPVVAVAVLATVGGVGLGYHPPIAVVSAGRPIDLSADVNVAGVSTRPLNGHLLLLWVQIRQPSLLGALSAMLHGDSTAPEGAPTSASDRRQAEAEGRSQYLGSQQTAVHDAEALLGLDPRRLRVSFRDRGLVGPSAGLVYALAIVDMVGKQDLLRGRTIAVTGELEPDGRVDAVGWVDVKAMGAARAGASFLLVPTGEQPALAPGRQRVFPVGDLRQAIAVLAR